MSQKPCSHRFFGEIVDINMSSIEPSSFCNCRNISQVVIDTLSESIKQHGLIQPIVVRALDDHFEIVAGYRRYMACKSLNWKKIPCHTVHLNDMQTFEIALVENMQRESLSPLEEARSFKLFVIEKGWGSISDLSFKLGKSPSYITKRISLLDLPQDVKQSIEKENLKPSSAEELLAIKDPERQSQLGKLIIKRHLTTMNARKLIREDPYYCENSEIIEVRSELQTFNKSIVILRIAMNKIAQLLDDENDEDEKDANLLIKELLMDQKRQLHDQIDMLMKAKRKYAKNIFRYRRIMEK